MVVNIELTDAIRHLFLIYGSLLSAFILAVVLTPPFVNLLFKYKIGKQIREETVDGKKATLFSKLHKKKSGTPTMGGIIIWGVTAAVVLITWLLSLDPISLFKNSLLTREETYLPMFTLIAAALLGAVDDWFNIKGIGKHKGLKAKPKMFWLILFGLLGGLWFYYKLGYDQIHVPFFGDFIIGAWYIPLFIFIIIACANCVNFTDGLDGLAGGLTIIAFGAYSIIAYLNGQLILSAFCAVIVGATLAFVWFNIPPALFYMGDTGSMSLGATLGVLAMLTDTVLILPLIAFVFVIEGLSVVIQLTSKKYFGRKVFHIAPIHHHFEHLGWGESKVVMRFWIVGLFFAILGVIIAMLNI